VIPASNALKLVNGIPGAWLAQFPHCGHAFIAQRPRALADLSNSFSQLIIPPPGRSDKVCRRRSGDDPFPGAFWNGPQGPWLRLLRDA
jgi:hypothetical protein